MQITIAGFGGRLRDARRAKGVSAKWMCGFINGYMCSLGYQPVTVKTYYSWEYIGTSREEMKGRSWPHPMVYRLISLALGITLYWLIYGDMGGRIRRESSALPASQQVEQIAAITGQDALTREVDRVKGRLTSAQQAALVNLLKTF